MSSTPLRHLLCRLALLLSLFITHAHAANLASWKSRSIYQTMTDRFARTDGSTTHACNTTAGLYCGGSWLGTLNHLDYIQGMGFDAVMISPIVENVPDRVSYGEAYHGYWPIDLYSLNEKFGTKEDLLKLSEGLHARGMYLMMDVVINNMAYVLKDGGNPARDMDYSKLSPFNKEAYFHPYCKITDWNNYTNAQNCQTGDLEVVLPDLYTEHEEVQTILEKWVVEMIKTYSIDGLRVDAAKHVDSGFLTKFVDSVKADTFVTGEVLEREVDIVCHYADNYIASMPNYPIYFAMLDALTNATTANLFKEVEFMKSACNDVTSFVSFSENHDQERIPAKNEDIAIAKNVLTFTLLFDGIPMIYQGQEQHLAGSGTPENREAIWLSKYNTNAPLYKHISTLNTLRKHVAALGADYLSTPTAPLYRDDGAIGFKKGVEGRHVVMLLSTQGSSQANPYTIPLKVAYNAGTDVVEVLGCTNYTVDNAGMMVVTMEKGEPRVFFPTKLMEGSGLCGYDWENVTLAELVAGVTETENPDFSGASCTRGGSPMVVVSLVVIFVACFVFGY